MARWMSASFAAQPAHSRDFPVPQDAHCAGFSQEPICIITAHIAQGENALGAAPAHVIQGHAEPLRLPVHIR